EAAASLDQAIALNPSLAEAYYNRGNALRALKRHEEALTDYDKAFEINPGADLLGGDRWLAQMSICNWRKLEDQTAQLLANIELGRTAAPQFVLLAMPASRKLQHHA